MTDREEGPQTREPAAGGEGHGRVGLLLSEVVPERIDWLWPGRIPKGKLTICEGDPGEGKSAMTTDIAARVSVGGPWPDGDVCEPAGVVICSAEDGLGDTIRPRLDAAGGDPSKVLALATVKDGSAERLLSIPEDLGDLKRGIERVGANLVIVDPLMAFLSGRHDAHRDQDVRRALAPLAQLAEGTGAALVVVRHLNKGSGVNPIYRGGGSIGIVGAARSALLVATHPDDDERRVLAPLKNNVAKHAPSLVFALAEAANGAVRVEWKGETSLSAAELLAGPRDGERDALAGATEFLIDVLAGGPVPAKEVYEGAKAEGIAKRAIERARKPLGVKASRKGEPGKRGGGAWFLSLPGNKPAERVGGDLNGGRQSGDRKDTAYPSLELGTGLRPPREDGVEEYRGDGGLNRGHGEDVGQSLTAFFTDPPEWFLDQAGACLEAGSPDRLVNPLSNSVATHLFGSPWRWREVLPVVRRWLERVAL